VTPDIVNYQMMEIDLMLVAGQLEEVPSFRALEESE
jgi:hypothetical protein